MGRKIRARKQSLEKKGRLFERRKESAIAMTIFNRRFLNNLRKNWEIKHRDHLLPNADTIFDFIDRNLTEMILLRNFEETDEWWKIVRDEEIVEGNIQESIAILSWVYWQRLEGYEVLDVSLPRGRSVEDIGCIQQFYNAADGLILEYQDCFNFQLPIDIMCIYGLYQYFHTKFHHFVMVPNQTRYEYIPAWISVAHEVAHIAIEELEDNYYSKWQEIQKTCDCKISVEDPNIDIREFGSEFTNKSLKKELVLEVFKDLSNVVDEIKEISSDEKCLPLMSLLLPKLEERLRVWYRNLTEKSLHINLIRDLNLIEDVLTNITSYLRKSPEMKEFEEKITRKISKIEFKICSLREYIEFERLSSTLFKNHSEMGLDCFFSDWKIIKKRAVDFTEIMLRVLEGDSGNFHLNEQKSGGMEHVSTSQHLLADIVATFLAGEYYIYSLIFYRFLPSVFLSEEGIIHPKQRAPMSLRLFICLETLRCSDWKDFGEMVEEIENLWEEMILGCNKETDLEKKMQIRANIEEKFENMRSKIEDEALRGTASNIWNLILLITEEDFSLEKEYLKLMKAAENNEGVVKDRFDRSYFSYMKHALGYTHRRMLRHPCVLVGTDSLNPLRELIVLVKETLIASEEAFTTKERYDTIDKIRKKLMGGEMVLNMGEVSDNELKELVTPRNILSAYTQIYFEDLLHPKRKDEFNHAKAFNATVMSMAWTQYSLRRFHD